MPKQKLLKYFFLFNFMVGCASYTEKSNEIRSAMYRKNYAEALQKLESSDIAKEKRSYVLYHMEKGTLSFLNDQYVTATKEWDLALKKIEDLYTVSISGQVASMSLNESFSDYEGEAHERLLLPIYSALAYIKNNSPEKAIVEIRKLYEISNELKDSKDERTTKLVIDRNFLSRALGGFIFEMQGKLDNAIIEYRAALDDSNIDTTVFEEKTAKTFAKALARLSELRHRSDVLTRLKSKFPGLTWEKQDDLNKQAEVLVVSESGRSPLKVPQDFVIPIAGNVTRISFPVYKDQSYSSEDFKIKVNGKLVGETQTALDIGELGKKALEERRTRDMVRMTARLIAKDQAARAIGRQLGPLAQLATSITGAVLETADTRSWTTLPDQIKVLRFPIPANKDVKIQIEPDHAQPSEYVLRLKAGEKKVIHVRSLR